MDLETALNEYRKWHRKVHDIESELRALREERSKLHPVEMLSEHGRQERVKDVKRILKRQAPVIVNWGNASQKRNRALSAIEKILRAEVELETK